MFALTAGENQPLLEDSHSEERLGAALQLHLTEVEIDRLHYRNMESGGSSCERSSVVSGQHRDEAPTRSTWPNSPTARVQTIWKSFSLVDERRSGSLSDLLARKTRGQSQVKDVNWASFSAEIVLRRRSLALGFLALLYFLPAAEYKSANYVFEGPERRKYWQNLGWACVIIIFFFICKSVLQNQTVFRWNISKICHIHRQLM